MKRVQEYRIKPGQSGGVALVIALILLLVLTILGIGAMNNTLMQERMAGNANLQALAFQAASAGIRDSLAVLDSGQACVRGQVNPPLIGQGFTLLTELSDALPDGTRAGYTLRAGCFEPEFIPPEWIGWDVPLQLLVLSTGFVCRGATCDGTNPADVLSVREVEVRVSPVGGDPECLFNIGPLAPGSFGKNSKSGAYSVDGGPDGCPIRFADPDDAVAFEQLLAGQGGGNSSRVGQWEPIPPGITSSPPRGIFGDPERMARSVNSVKIGVRAFQEWGLTFTEWGGGNPFNACSGRLFDDGDDVGVVPNALVPVTPQIIYVASDFTTAGQSVGALQNAVIIVEGEFTINGGTDLQDADVLMLGGYFDISGWGSSVNSSLIYLENLRNRNPFPSLRVAYDPENATLEPSTYFNISGMGSATVDPVDCEGSGGVIDRWEQLNSCIDSLRPLVTPGSGSACPLADPAHPLYDPAHPNFPFSTQFECYIAQMGSAVDTNTANPANFDFPEPDLAEFDIPGCGGPAGGGTRNVIASWREYIDRSRWQNL